MTRTLKIEADGDPWKGSVKPKIRLTGHWLEQAGFRPGGRVQVVCAVAGLIELRSMDAEESGRPARPSTDGLPQ